MRSPPTAAGSNIAVSTPRGITRRRPGSTWWRAFSLAATNWLMAMIRSPRAITAL